MTTTVRRPRKGLRYLWIGALCAAICLAVALKSPHAAKRRSASPSPMTKVVAMGHDADDPVGLAPLSFSDEFDRAELVDRMLAECRGVPYNAYELAQTSGESLWLPAPIQLMVVRVRHPYCAELLRTYAPKAHV
jgi:hypothetical protein